MSPNPNLTKNNRDLSLILNLDLTNENLGPILQPYSTLKRTRSLPEPKSYIDKTLSKSIIDKTLY